MLLTAESEQTVDVCTFDFVCNFVELLCDDGDVVLRCTVGQLCVYFYKLCVLLAWYGSPFHCEPSNGDSSKSNVGDHFLRCHDTILLLPAPLTGGLIGCMMGLKITAIHRFGFERAT